MISNYKQKHMTKIVVTGGSGRFGRELKKHKTKHKIYYPNKNEFDILNLNKLRRYLLKKKPKILIHLAGLSRPMNIHDTFISKSIDINIIGTANVVKVCSELNVKLPTSSLDMFVVGARQSLQASIFDSLLKTNDVYKFYPSTKTDLIHCQLDTYVPIANSEIAFNYMSAGSDMVNEKYLENGDHIDCIFSAFLAAFTEVENLDE